MSIKRQAPTNLNHDNWDQEEPSEPEDMGTFKTASKEELEKRVIKTAKRRTRTTFGSDEAKKNVFTGFGGFNKAQPQSFDFLSKLTNGSKTEDDSTKTQTEASATGSLFKTNPINKSWSPGEFTIPSTEGNSKHTFGTPTTVSSIFRNAANSVSNNIKTETTTSTPFQIQTTQVAVKSPDFTIKTTETNSVSAPKTFASVFGSNFQTLDTTKSITANSTSPKQQIALNSTPMASPAISTNENKANDTKDERKMKYYSKIKGLNESVSEWICKHVKETPLCILTPIFKDYEKYLKDIQEEYEGANILRENKSNITETANNSIEKSGTENKTETKSSSSIFSSQSTSLFKNASNTPISTGAVGTGFSFGINTTSSNNVNTSNSSTLASNITDTPKGANGSGFSFGINTSSANTINTSNASTPLTSNTPFSTGATGGGFSFGIKTSSANTNNSNASTPLTSNTAISPGAVGSGFSFGINTSSTNTVSTSNASTPFSFTTNTTLSGNNKTPFSFGSDKPFSFSSNIQKPVEKTENDKDEDDEPPKVEYTPVVEDNSVFEKKCKVFVKKADNFVDNGVGTLYIKKVEESGKHQLLVRANTNLGNVLLNLILSASIPLQRTGKNNVMMVCIPNPDAKPPPVPILIRVKTSDDADELLEILNKYKS